MRPKGSLGLALPVEPKRFSLEFCMFFFFQDDSHMIFFFFFYTAVKNNEQELYNT
jgi:hypothetical protein